MIKVWWDIVGEIWKENLLLEGSVVVPFLTKKLLNSSQTMAKGREASRKSRKVVHERQAKRWEETDLID